MGREEKRLIKHDNIDLDAAAKKFVVEHDPRDRSGLDHPVWMGWLMAQCAAAAKSVPTRSRNEWLRANAEAIAAAGLEESVAYDLYLAGRVAELRYALEEELISAIASEVDEGTVDSDSVH